MGRFFWFIIGAIGLVLIFLVASGDTGTTLGFETGQFATFSIMALWALLIGSSMFGRGVHFGNVAKQLAIWFAIILGVMSLYVFRFDIQDFGSKFSGGIIPGSPIARTGVDGREEVTLIRSENGHFEAVAGVNGESIRFLVDTGASAIVLSAEDAEAAGIDLDSLSYSIITQTANGRGYLARAAIESLYIGGIERENLTVTVAERGKLSKSLLGQQFLESLSSYEKRGDRLTLRD